MIFEEKDLSEFTNYVLAQRKARNDNDVNKLFMDVTNAEVTNYFEQKNAGIVDLGPTKEEVAQLIKQRAGFCAEACKTAVAMGLEFNVYISKKYIPSSNEFAGNRTEEQLEESDTVDCNVGVWEHIDLIKKK